MAIHQLMGSTAPAAAQLGELAIALGSEVDLDAVLAQSWRRKSVCCILICKIRCDPSACTHCGQMLRPITLSRQRLFDNAVWYSVSWDVSNKRRQR
jgi:hypothetical protein